jgi:carboxyl-terminal processing protease
MSVKHTKRIVEVVIVLTMLMGSAAAAGRAAARGAAPVIDGAAVLAEAWQVVNERFYDKGFNGIDWPAMLQKHRPAAAKARSPEELAQVVNAMLAELKTSHMGFYTPADREYYELIDIFSRGGEFSEQIERKFPRGVRYEGIGIVTREMGGKVFIADVVDGLPAHQAGLQVGNEVIAVDDQPYQPIRSFFSKAGESVEMLIQATEDPSSRREIDVAVDWIAPRKAFGQSINDSARIIELQAERGGLRIGYVRIRSYASEKYHEALTELVTGEGKLAEADALVLDLRGGWGGASPEYLNLFNRNVPAMTMIDRQGGRHSRDSQWRKPVVLLVDDGTRSGKEVLAHGFKRYGIGRIVGTRTAGAVIGGGPALISDGSFLMVAVVDVEIDGERLEGRGVEPDVFVEFDLPYAQGRDPQLDRALEIAQREVSQQK